LLGAGLALCTFASGAAVAAEPDVDGADRMPETARGANWSILGLEKKRRIFFKVMTVYGIGMSCPQFAS
jgi:hypothetical protein